MENQRRQMLISFFKVACYHASLLLVNALCTGQDRLSVWILFPDWNIKHDQCKAKMINFYFDHVVLAKYKYKLSQSIVWIDWNNFNDWTDWIDWTQLTRWFLLKLRIWLCWFIWFSLVWANGHGGGRTDGGGGIAFPELRPASGWTQLKIRSQDYPKVRWHY